MKVEEPATKNMITEKKTRTQFLITILYYRRISTQILITILYYRRISTADIGDTATTIFQRGGGCLW